MVTRAELNWADARDYCEQHYEGLATLSTDHGRQRLYDISPRLLQGTKCLTADGHSQCEFFWVGGYKEDDKWYWVLPGGKRILHYQQFEAEENACMVFAVTDGALFSGPCFLSQVFVCNN